MGRISRRNIDKTIQETPLTMEVVPTAIYARLSIENSGKDDDGAAIENQIDVCKEYINDMSDLKLVKVYKDNGWTGTNMNRPAFDELMADVESGLIRAVVVRDLSRLARNYIESGTYLESVFPELNVRFISVKEKYDSLKTDGTNESLMVPLQNLINDLYAKDISKKVESALHAQMEEGKFKWRAIPYGYKMNDDHTNIIPDEETAPFIQSMFQWYADGISFVNIACKLDAENAPKYKRGDKRNMNLWNPASIHNMLQNPAYIGKRIIGRSHRALYKGIKNEKVPETEWYVTDNAHEPLVSTELFEKVNMILTKNSEKWIESVKHTENERAKLVNNFKGKIFCADCGYGMYFHRHCFEGKYWRADYYCSSKQSRKWINCTSHYINMKTLNEKVLEALKLQIKLAVNYEDMIKRLGCSDKAQKVRNRLNDTIKGLSIKAGNIQNRKIRLYEDYIEGIIDEEEYLYMKSAYEREYDQLNQQLESCIKKRNEYIEAFSSENKWIKMMKGIRSKKKLTKEVVDATIEKVTVYEGGRIEITMKYQDIFDLTKSYITEFSVQEEASNG